MSDEPSTTATEATDRRLRNRDEQGRQTPFVPTEAQRMRVRQLAKAFPPPSEHLLARMMGFSKDTLLKHFLPELEMGRAELVASCAAQEIALAMDANAAKDLPGKPAIAKGDPQARRFVLIKMGGWANLNRVEVGPPGSFGEGPVDLSKFTEEQLKDYGRLSAIHEGLDPDLIVAELIGDGAGGNPA